MSSSKTIKFGEAPSRAVPGEPQPQCPGVKPTRWAPMGVGHFMRCRGRASRHCTWLTMGCLQEEQGWIYMIWGGASVRKQRSK